MLDRGQEVQEIERRRRTSLSFDGSASSTSISSPADVVPLEYCVAPWPLLLRRDPSNPAIVNFANYNLGDRLATAYSRGLISIMVQRKQRDERRREERTVAKSVRSRTSWKRALAKVDAAMADEEEMEGAVEGEGEGEGERGEGMLADEAQGTDANIVGSADDDDGLEVLEMRLACCSLHAPGVAAICQTLQYCDNLRVLDLSSNILGASCIHVS